MTEHNKLVRNQIPNLLRDSGKNIRTRYFNIDENKDSLTKLADPLEVIHALSYTQSHN
ncbi:hypothetical protein ACJA3J_06945 [Halobacillus sp. SY10]|uniref:Uncharacterized protein n=1 Tax=Halobacillus aidingensis TaxID=240303 RepID=A0A1H0SKT9_HALAD|nr:hypothetical protein [Halobacillus aidingensis]SDP42452.1 hypothetical protein SAMN05421677_11880 [Halobacillus aidingensis]